MNLEVDYSNQLLADCKCVKHRINWQYKNNPILIFDDVSFALTRWHPIELTLLQKIKRWIKNNILRRFKKKNKEVRIFVSSHCFICGKGWRFHPEDTYWDHNKRSYE